MIAKGLIHHDIDSKIAMALINKTADLFREQFPDLQWADASFETQRQVRHLAELALPTVEDKVHFFDQVMKVNQARLDALANVDVRPLGIYRCGWDDRNNLKPDGHLTA